MPKFKVLRRIEHNHVLYLREGEALPEKSLSAGSGKEIPIDSSGRIDLSAAEAAAMLHGQIDFGAAQPPRK